MLCARRKSDGQTVNAYFESKRNGPFACLVCREEVILKTGRSRINHFAHANPIACKFAEGESDEHRRCKTEIFLALQKAPRVSDVILERPLETVRPDVSAIINGTPVAIEVQLSSLSIETIMRRTIDYAQRGIYVLWLLQWTPNLDSNRYSPRLWEKWIHAAYFGRVYYWIEGLTVASYHFDPNFKSIPQKSWYSKDNRKMAGGGYSVRTKRYRTPVRGETLNLVRDFAPKERYWWEGNGLKVPDAKLFMHDTRRGSFVQRPSLN
jgi:competence protein CoiA